MGKSFSFTQSQSKIFLSKDYKFCKSSCREYKCTNSDSVDNHSLSIKKSVGFTPRILNRSTKTIVISSAFSIATFLLFKQPVVADNYLDMVQQSASDSGLIQSFLLIFISEIGDKTFFIAALLAAKYGKFISFTGSIAALAVMTIISTVLGQLFHAVPASITQGIPFDDYVAVAAFSYFGIKTLIDASKLADGDSSGIEEEKAEAEEIVEELTIDQKRSSVITLILQTFSLVFAAEIGDR